MKVDVDAQVCQATEFCVELAPDLFEIDPDGYAVVRVDVVPASLVEAAREAFTLCPTRAISLED